MIFEHITLHDYSIPVEARRRSRAHCGPYQWTPTNPGSGRAFYMGADMQCAPHGAGFRLRVEDANDHLGRSRTADILGYYTDEFGDSDTLKPIVLRLPRGRGFLAGWTMGENMCASIDSDIYEDAETAAYAAHSAAEHDAELERAFSDEESDDET